MVIRSSKDFGAFIRRERQKLNMRQTDLAKAASVRQALISDLENGVGNAKLDTIIKILAALGLDLAMVKREKLQFNPTEY